MKLFHKESKQKKETRNLPIGHKKSRKRLCCFMQPWCSCCAAAPPTAFAASDPLTVINNLSDFIFGLIRAVGYDFCWASACGADWPFSEKAMTPASEPMVFSPWPAGVVITFAKEILTLITG